MARILVIEDNATNLQLMSYLLRAFGHTVIEAMDGEEGLDAVAREAPEVIVCDVHIPGIDGHEVCRRLKADPAYRDIPLIAVTALAMVGDRAAIMTTGFDGYIAKPIDPTTFVAEVESFVRGVPAIGPRITLGGEPTGHRTDETASHAPEPPGAATAGVPSAGILLVIDDLAANLVLMRSIFEPFGYRVLLAGTVVKALAMLERYTPDIIVSDVHLPDRTGFDFIRAVKADARWCHVPFIFITSTAWPDSEARTGLLLGAERWLVRPIEPRELLAEIEGCLKETAKV